MRDFTLKVEVKLSATGANGGIQYRSRLLHPAHGGSIANPLGKPLAGQDHDDGPGGRRGDHGRARAARRRPGRRRPRRAAELPPCAGAPADPALRGRTGRRAGGASAESVRRRSRQPHAASAARPAAGTRPATPTGNPWQVSGYQFDMDSSNQYTGQLYEGQGRNIITAPGTIGMLLPGNCKILLGKMAGDAKAAIKPHQGLDGEWQQIEIIVRGNTMIHIINGQVMSITVDDDPVARAPQGILSLQLEGSGQIWYRNVYLKQQDKSLDFPR